MKLALRILMVALAMVGNTVLLSEERRKIDAHALQALLDKIVDGKSFKGAVLHVSYGDGRSWYGAAGNMSPDAPYFVASVTKLYTTALVYILVENNQINLNDPIYKYVSADIMKGLHTYKAKDYSTKITIGHLLSHTSGIPDYYEQKVKDGASLKSELLANHDQRWSGEQAIALSKQIDPNFPPGEKGRAHYSDTNFQLLGLVIEKVTGLDYGTALKQFIFEPLGLHNTYLYSDSSSTLPTPICFKKAVLSIPKAMASFGPDGGIVSTADESMIFLKAFFAAQLFSEMYLKEMQSWNKIFYPLEYGQGIMRFKLARIFSPFKPTPEFIGHSGSSGSFAFYCPDIDAYFSGTLNQISKPGKSFQLMLKAHNILVP